MKLYYRFVSGYRRIFELIGAWRLVPIDLDDISWDYPEDEKIRISYLLGARYWSGFSLNQNCHHTRLNSGLHWVENAWTTAIKPVRLSNSWMVLHWDYHLTEASFVNSKIKLIPIGWKRFDCTGWLWEIIRIEIVIHLHIVTSACC